MDSIICSIDIVKTYKMNMDLLLIAVSYMVVGVCGIVIARVHHTKDIEFLGNAITTWKEENEVLQDELAEKTRALEKINVVLRELVDTFVKEKDD